VSLVISPRIAASRRIAIAACFVLILTVLSLVVGAGPAFAATHISGTTYTSNTTWTVANSPYVLDGNVTVAAGATLTIEPGVIVKFNGMFRELSVNGTLSALGTSASHIVFTSYQDDTAGGDTNGDGASTSGQPGQWYAISVNSGNAGSGLRFADVRFGGLGSAKWNYGALSISGSGTSVLAEDSTFSSNQASGIHVGIQDTAGVTVRRSTLNDNGDGISANGGWMKVEDDTLVRNNSEDGLWWNLAAGFTGPQSHVLDSEVRNNGRDGIRLQVETNLDVNRWPRGTRSNIYANTGKQLYTLNEKRTADWKRNYWGSDVYFRRNQSVCFGTGHASLGKLAYTWSQSGQFGQPPEGPIDANFDTAGSTVCGYDRVAIGPIEFQPFPFRGATGVPVGQAIGCSADGELGENPSAACKQDPVNTATGSLTHEVTDLTMPATGVSFALTRYYNSIDPTAGPLGPGWTHTYNASLTINAGGDVTAHAGSGQQLEFIKNADGSFTAAKGGRGTLTTIAGGYELISYDQLHYRFDTAGKPTSLKDRNDKGLTFAYDGSSRLSTITDASNRQVTLTYDGSGLLTQVSAPGPRSVSYGYTSGRLTSFTDAAGKVWTYTYEQYGFLEKEIDPLSHTIFRNVYGVDGRVVEQYDPLNNKTAFAWDAATQTQTVTDARNNVWKDVYSNNVLQKEIDALGRETQLATTPDLNVSSVTGPDAKTTSMTYDTKGNMLTATGPASIGSPQKTLVYDSQNNVTSVTDARGKVTTYGYDGNGNNTTIVQDGIAVATYTYNASDQVTSFKDGRNNITTYTYDSNGNLESETNALGDKTTYTYDAAGRMLTRVDPRGNVQGADPNQFKWTYTYDGAGRTLTETSPLGHVTTHAYDNAGNETSVTDANNKTTTYTYDNANRVLTVTAPDTGVTTYTYDAVGNKLTERNPNNKTTTYTYDANNRLASVTTPLGNKTTYSYDVSGNRTKEVEPRGNVTGANPDDYATTFTYDAAGRLLTETDPLGNVTTYTYNAVGKKLTVKDANNQTTTYAYNGRNLLTSVTAPGGAATTYTYDNAGNLTTRTDAKDHQTMYVYDTANQLTGMTLPLNRQWTYAYDAAGNRTQMVDANGNSTQTAGDGTTTYSYDGSGRLTGINYSDSTPDVTYTYDGVGNRTQMTDGATDTYAYDGVNRLTQATRAADTVSYTYDLAGNITRRTYPDSTVVDYSYDDDSRLATVVSSGQTTTYTYDAAGNVGQTALPSGNGYVEERTYDRAGRLTRKKSSKAGSTLADFTYTLDAVGNPTQIVRGGAMAGTTTYSYDNRDRLTEVCFQAACPGGSDPFIRWTYDVVGNRLTETRSSGATTYSYNASDELTAAGSTTYGYDENGNQTSAGATALSYDLANRLKTVTKQSGTTTYEYDGDGKRLQVTFGGQTSKFLWDVLQPAPQLLLERNASNQLIRRYIYGVERISMATQGGTFYYHYGPVGSVVNVTGATGGPQWTYAYEPFGQAHATTKDDPNAPDNPARFAAEYLSDTGLYHLRARDLDAATGRLTATDPVAPSREAPYVSGYVYAADRPTFLVDPTGQTSKPARDGQVAVRESSSSGAVLTPEGGGPLDARTLASANKKGITHELEFKNYGTLVRYVNKKPILIGNDTLTIRIETRGRKFVMTASYSVESFIGLVSWRMGWFSWGLGGGRFVQSTGRKRAEGFAGTPGEYDFLFTGNTTMRSGPDHTWDPFPAEKPMICDPERSGLECFFEK
jgi:RHS repeat-associated protein